MQQHKEAWLNESQAQGDIYAKALQVMKGFFVSTAAAGDELPLFSCFQGKDSLLNLSCPQSTSQMEVSCCKKLRCSAEEKTIQLQIDLSP